MEEDLESGRQLGAAVTTGLIPNSRRHDLDALRSAAMLMGIALHGALSFCPGLLWPVQDVQQQDGFSLFFAVLHGFRMPLFFLLSGFFTAMLWRKHGMKFLLGHRAKRVLLPLCLFSFTVVPILNWTYGFVIFDALKSSEVAQKASPNNIDGSFQPEKMDLSDINEATDKKTLNLLFEVAVRQGDIAALEVLLGSGADINFESEIMVTPLHWATGLGRSETVEFLLEQGADIDSFDSKMSTPLHWAAIFGRPEVVTILVGHGANLNIQNTDGVTPLDLVTEESRKEVAGVALFLGSLMVIPVDYEELISSYGLIYSTLLEHGAKHAQGSLQGNGFGAILNGLMVTPVFHHLWFLWFLCLLVAAFSLAVWMGTFITVPVLTPLWINSPLRYLWMVPLTAVFQFQMDPGVIGPDTSTAIIPPLHILCYYAVFFGFGALYFKSDDAMGSLGRRWWITIPLALFVLFPAALHASGEPGNAGSLIGAVYKALFTCLLCFGLMGLFRRILYRGNKWIRYISDSSYWMYVVHLPLIIILQWLVRDWEAPATIKFIGICGSATFLLLASYAVGVRYTWLGAILNGPKSRNVLAIDNGAKD